MTIQGLKLVTFDVTNTLLKFKQPAWHYYTMIAYQHGFKGTEKDVKEGLQKSFKIMWDKHPNFGKDTIKWEKWWCSVVSMTLKDHLPANADINGIANTLINEFKTDKCWRIAQGSDRLIGQLKSQGLNVGVISNFDPRLSDILQSVSLHSNFDFIVTSYETGYSKPDERIFKAAIDKCNKDIKPSEALHVGDDLVKDYKGARAAGWHAILVNANVEPPDKASQAHMFKDLEELDKTIQRQKLKL